MVNPLSMLESILFTISNSLLYPVIIAVVGLSGWMVFYAGGFFAEWLNRKRSRKNINITTYLIEISREKKLSDNLKLYLPDRVINYVDQLSLIISEKSEFLQEKVENLLQEKEIKIKKDLDKIRLLIRLGPSLGLMGTLIPMGAALAALGRGDMIQLTSSLTVAFTTTVVGLGLGVVALFFSTIKEHWMYEDIKNIELITEAMTKGITKDEVYEKTTCLQ